MPKKGLVFIENRKPENGDSFEKRVFYRYFPPFKVDYRDLNGGNIIHKQTRQLQTDIHLDVYDAKVCVLSFHQAMDKRDPYRYRKRHELSPGHLKNLFQACVDAHFQECDKLEQEYAFAFAATNDIGKAQEHNKRKSAYELFLERYYPNFDNCQMYISDRANTYMIHSLDFAYKNIAEEFYNEFEELKNERAIQEENERIEGFRSRAGRGRIS